MKRLRHNWFIIGKYNPVIKGQRFLRKQNKGCRAKTFRIRTHGHLGLQNKETWAFKPAE
jgi:hypothetical protein